MKKFVLGVDIGGTNTKIGLVSPQGKIAGRTFFSTLAYSKQKDVLINQLILSCKELLSKNNLSASDILGIGIGLPGLINTEKGVVHSLTNISGWNNVPLKNILEAHLSIPVFIDNDVNVITLGEWKHGSGKGKKNIICITLGTGIGGGLILDDRLYRGEGFAAGEIGHAPVQRKGRKCNCGGHGCFETFAGSLYLQRKIKLVFKNRDLSLEDIACFAKKGDHKARKFWCQVGQEIGIGLTGVINILNPSCVIIGGGIANAYCYMRQSIIETIHQRAMRVQGRMAKLLRSKLNINAGIIGAKVLVQEQQELFKERISLC